MTRKDRKLRFALATLAAAILPILGIGMTNSAAQKERALPNIASANVPFYPRIPQVAHIEGVVRLRISTDGTQASSIKVESGQPMLAQAAKENVMTWRFEQHNPTTFEATFRYRLLPSKCDSECNCDSPERDLVRLNLPSDIEVAAKELLTCDPAIQRKH
jgi:hypothetical protein